MDGSSHDANLRLSWFYLLLTMEVCEPIINCINFALLCIDITFSRS